MTLLLQTGIGLGTWRMGESRAGSATRRAEVAAVRLAIDIGYRLVDTAEMYGEGGAEEVVGEAVAEALAAGAVSRDALVVVSKVYPHNASARGVLAACERSRRRLRLDRIDLYLLHWRGHVPLAETLEGFEQARARGWIGAWGVSNFDVDDLEELVALPGGAACAANQVYHSLGERGPEFALLPWQRERGMPLIAHSPIDQGALASVRSGAKGDALRTIAERHGATPVQVALAALLAKPGVVAIPQSSRDAHLRENWAARTLTLSADDLAVIDRAFPPPRTKRPLATT